MKVVLCPCISQVLNRLIVHTTSEKVQLFDLWFLISSSPSLSLYHIIYIILTNFIDEIDKFRKRGGKFRKLTTIPINHTYSIVAGSLVFFSFVEY